MNDITMNFIKEGESLVFTPFLNAERLCYVYQIPVYSQYFTVYSIDPRGAGVSSVPNKPYSTY